MCSFVFSPCCHCGCFCHCCFSYCYWSSLFFLSSLSLLLWLLLSCCSRRRLCGRGRCLCRCCCSCCCCCHCSCCCYCSCCCCCCWCWCCFCPCRVLVILLVSCRFTIFRYHSALGQCESSCKASWLPKYATDAPAWGQKFHTLYIYRYYRYFIFVIETQCNPVGAPGYAWVFSLCATWKHSQLITVGSWFATKVSYVHCREVSCPSSA